MPRVTSHVSLSDEAVDADTQLLRARGELDLYAAPELKRRLASAIDAGKTRIVVDLTDASFMDSTALGVLLGALKRLRVRDGALAVASEQPTILRILEVTGMNQVLDLHKTADDALATVERHTDSTP
ncbi:MAG: STAS domain-containing protein [Solirubrobacteraceae bacterium]|jgi:anti-sigma B factor antagonist